MDDVKWLLMFGLVLAALALFLVLLNRFAPVTAARWALAVVRRWAGLTLKRAVFDSVQMPYLDGGSGEAVLLLHGFGGDKDNFTLLARFLTRHYRVIAPDLPGFGDASRDPAASHRIVDQVERLHAFVETLGLKRFHLGGNSMGGFIAAEYAARYPEQLISLWLLDAAGTAAAHDSPTMRQYVATGELPLLLRTPQAFTTLLHTATSRPPYLPYCVKLLLGRRGAADFDLHSRIFQDVVVSPLLETRRQPIRVPALIMWGSEDRVLNPAAAPVLHELIPGSQVVVLPGIGHLPMYEVPRKTAQAFRSFLAQGQAAPARG
ncbi:MAG: alpha/beta hydrolase [Burkholderiaceae bacterium]|nr:alpha/beta hydrolase [Burkholderiaceae bacterium]